MFFTPSTICCGGVVLDYFSMWMIINEQTLLPTVVYRYAFTGIYIFFLV